MSVPVLADSSLGHFLRSRLMHDEKEHASGKRRKNPHRTALEKRFFTVGDGPSTSSTFHLHTLGAAEASVSMASFQATEAILNPALRHMGARRFRRLANDLLLRELAGPLSAQDMRSLFAPIPFGQEPHPSPFALAMSTANRELFDLFRSINMDREAKVLARWEAHIAEGREAAAAARPLPAAVLALRAWSGVSRQARVALKRAPLAMIEAIELRLIAFATSDDAVAGRQLVFDGADAFQRLLVHGLCAYHGQELSSRSFDAQDGSRSVAVALRVGGAEDEEAPSSDAEGFVMVALSAAEEGAKAQEEATVGAEEVVLAVQEEGVLCCDLLLLLQQLQAQGGDRQGMGLAHIKAMHMSATAGGGSAGMGHGGDGREAADPLPIATRTVARASASATGCSTAC